MQHSQNATLTRQVCCLLLLCFALRAQSAAPAATADDVKYFRFLLMNLAGVNYSPDTVAAYRNYLGVEHGLDDQEMSAIDSGVTSLHTLSQQIEQSSAQIRTGKTVLSPADLAALQSLFAQREGLITLLANQLLNIVRPQVASSFRIAGRLVAAAIQHTPAPSSSASPPAPLTSLAALQDCASAEGAGDCLLAPGAYTVPFIDSSGRQQPTLQIGRSGFTISGMGDASETVIQRSASDVSSLMVAADSTITGVTITNLTFDGNRYGFGGVLNCLPANAPIYELDLSYGGNFTVQYVDFVNAPGYALQVAGTSTVSYSHFGWGAAMESAQQTATRSTAVWISGNHGGAYFNNIGFAGTAGINLAGDSLIAYGNLLLNNRYEMPDGQGGQIYLVPGSLNASVAANVIDGNYWETNPGTALATGCQASQTSGTQQPYGVEAYGFGHSFYNNEVVQHTGTGMVFGGGAPAGEITVSSTNPWTSQDVPRFIESNLGNGMWFLGTHFFDFPYPVQGAKLDGLLVRKNGAYGVLLDSVSNSGAYTGFANGSCMSENAWGNVYAPNNGLTDPYPASYISNKAGLTASEVSASKPCIDSATQSKTAR